MKLNVFNCVVWSMISGVVMTGCASMGSTGYPSYEKDMALKTIRAELDSDEYSSMASTFSASSKGPGLLFRKTWGDQAKKYRWAWSVVHTGSWHYAGYNQPTFASIPDQLPYLEKGDIVEILYGEIQYDFDFNNLKSPKIVKLVCKHTDSSCKSKIKKDNEWNALTGIIVQTPDISSLTYTPNKPAAH